MNESNEPPMSKPSRSALLSGVRRIYEKRPYPGVEEKVVEKPSWQLPPMEWIGAIGNPGREQSPPGRILIAGCGAGSEAFALRRRFPKAEIVGVDFSPRSIAVARKLQQRNAGARSIRFVVADLSRVGLAETVGSDFDFVSCHGVLSYIPSPERVLKNLARCLRDDGALYLGVNGSQHFSVGLRPTLEAFGFDISELEDGRKLRDVLKLSDAILGLAGSHRRARFMPELLASDLFGSFIQNLPLSDWVRIAGEARLHFQGSYDCWRMLRPAMEKAAAHRLIPRSRARMDELAELLSPAAFHSLVFTKQPIPDVPWNNHGSLLAWHPRLTSVYNGSFPDRSRSWQGTRRFTLKSPATNTRLDWRMTEWELEILRQSNGKRSLGEILKGVPVAVPPNVLRNQLYALYQLLVINMVHKPIPFPRRAE